jgi:hypothetical protein
LAGYLIGKDDFNGEHSCPATGPCPTPLDAHNEFHQGTALVVGVVVALLVFVVIAAISRASRRTNRLQ